MAREEHVIFKTQFLKNPGEMYRYRISRTLQVGKNHKNGPDYDQQTKLTDYNVQFSYMKDYRIQKEGENNRKVAINKNKAGIKRADMVEYQVRDNSTGCRGNIDA